MDRTAGIIVIGNEILSGKVVDTNSPFLTRELRSLGVTVRRIVTIPDELDEIAAAVADFQARYDLVFTSGGVGPTHDDVTMEGVARGLKRRVIRHPAIESRIREYFKDKVNEARLKMAEVPEGAELIAAEELTFPAVLVRNIYVLPGVPEIFRQKFQALRERFRESPFHLNSVFVDMPEGTLADHLNDLLRRHPELMLGSYPEFSNPEYKVKVTIESKDRAYVERAVDDLLRQLPAAVIVRVER